MSSIKVKMNSHFNSLPPCNLASSMPMIAITNLCQSSHLRVQSLKAQFNRSNMWPKIHPKSMLGEISDCLNTLLSYPTLIFWWWVKFPNFMILSAEWNVESFEHLIKYCYDCARMRTHNMSGGRGWKIVIRQRSFR